MYLSKIATKVTMVVRRNEFRAPKGVADRVLACENVQVRYETSITRVDGDVFFGILHCFCRILRRCQRAAGDAHCKSQKQGQELPHNCYTSQIICASARWSV